MNLNSGLFYLRSNQRTIALLDRIALRLSKEKVGNGGAHRPHPHRLAAHGDPSSFLHSPSFLPALFLLEPLGRHHLPARRARRLREAHPLASTSAEFVIRGAHLWRQGVRAVQ